MYLRLCKKCNTTFKTILRYAEFCESCKYEIRKDSRAKIETNRKTNLENKNKIKKSIDDMKEIVKDDPFIMLRM